LDLFFQILSIKLKFIGFKLIEFLEIIFFKELKVKSFGSNPKVILLLIFLRI